MCVCSLLLASTRVIYCTPITRIMTPSPQALVRLSRVRASQGRYPDALDLAVRATTTHPHLKACKVIIAIMESECGVGIRVRVTSHHTLRQPRSYTAPLSHYFDTLTHARPPSWSAAAEACARGHKAIATKRKKSCTTSFQQPSPASLSSPSL